MGDVRRGPGVAALSVVVVSLLVAGSCTRDEASTPVATTRPPATNPPPATGAVLRLGVVGVDSLDPADVVPTNIASMVATDLLFESLTQIEPGAAVAVPALASQWRSSADLVTWTFTLGSGRFSDGAPVAASDVKFSLERVADKGNSSIAGSRLELIAGYREFLNRAAPDIAGVRAVDERTLEITMREPFAGLPEMLSSPLYGVVSRRAVEERKSRFAEEPVGSGLFAVESGGPDRVVLRRSAGAGGAAAGSGAGSPTAVELVRFADEAAAYAAMGRGDVDWAKVPPEALGAPAPRGTIVVQPWAAEVFYGINLRHPAFANPLFRQAIVRSIDRERIVSELISGAVRMDGVVPRSVPGAVADACGEACRFDPAAARALVAQAFPAGDVPTVSIDYYIDPDDKGAVQEKIAQAMAADLQAAGIPSAVDGKTFEEYRTFATSGNQQVFSYGWVGIDPDPDTFLAPLFLSGSQDNAMGFASAEVDAAIRAARATDDRATRVEAYAAIERMVMAQVPLVPLAGYQVAIAVAPRCAVWRCASTGRSRPNG